MCDCAGCCPSLGRTDKKISPGDHNVRIQLEFSSQPSHCRVDYVSVSLGHAIGRFGRNHRLNPSWRRIPLLYNPSSGSGNKILLILQEYWGSGAQYPDSRVAVTVFRSVLACHGLGGTRSCFSCNQCGELFDKPKLPRADSRGCRNWMLSTAPNTCATSVHHRLVPPFFRAARMVAIALTPPGL